ncbi:MCE family protein [Pseudonocardiaceae bacterium YIM PH 21723]|nr:MCE family protein [Pseudonocardiaceae bacterium YIM PH 21723]
MPMSKREEFKEKLLELKSFRERDPFRMGLYGVAVFAVFVALSIVVPQVVFYVQTGTYHAEFANASGLKPGDQVFIAGIPSGRVSKVELGEDNKVIATFRLDTQRELGDSTKAGVRVQTVLGKRYLDIKPSGTLMMDYGSTIPLSHTSVPFTLDDLGRAATDPNRDELDIDAIRTMIATLNKNMPEPDLTSQTLTGVAAVSKALGERSQQIKSLLTGTQQVTGALVEQQDTLVALVRDADLIVKVLNERRETVRSLLNQLATLSTQLNSFSKENKDQIDPLLTRLHTLTNTLNENDKNLGDWLTQLAGFTKSYGNIAGNGPWFDGTSPTVIIPDNMLCQAHLIKGCS